MCREVQGDKIWSHEAPFIVRYAEATDSPKFIHIHAVVLEMETELSLIAFFCIIRWSYSSSGLLGRNWECDMAQKRGLPS